MSSLVDVVLLILAALVATAIVISVPLFRHMVDLLEAMHHVLEVIALELKKRR